MYWVNGFSYRANRAIDHSISLAAGWGHTYIGSEHLLLGILKLGEGEAFDILNGANVLYQPTRQVLLDKIGKGTSAKLGEEDFSVQFRQILRRAMSLAEKNNKMMVGTPELLFSLLQETGCKAHGLLKLQEIDIAALLQKMPAGMYREQSMTNNEKKMGSRPARTAVRGGLLERYSRDLTEEARCGRLDPVIGRDKEMLRLMQILCRRSKNNPCIIGEAGVGKTALVEGLARRICEGIVPENLRGIRLLALDMSSLVAGTKYRGDFEERIKNLVDEVCVSRNVVLFIDEIHTLVGTGVAEGAVDAANILKPQLARGDFQVIGATTAEEYRKYIQKDAALDRRFQSVLLEEPSPEDAVEILKGLRIKYENHHKVSVTDEAIRAAVGLSVRYLNDRQLPDKAIDLIDEAASKLRLRYLEKSEQMVCLENRLKEIRRQKFDLQFKADTAMEQSLSKEEKQTAAQLEQARKEWRKKGKGNGSKLLREHIAALLSDMTGIEASEIDEKQGRTYLMLEETLKCRIVGQNEAVEAVARAIRRSRAGMRDERRPVGSFLFLGPTGVGKTQLCKTLAQQLFGDEKGLIRLDMTEYMEAGSVARLLGAPPGYVGYNQGSHALEPLRTKPYSVVLFDEVEKAHPDVLGVLLQAMDDGMVTDAKGRKISFRNAVVVMTSNIGWQHLSRKSELGFGEWNDQTVEKKRHLSVMGELKKFFRPEFLNRLDEIVVFHPLDRKDVAEIALMLLQQVVCRLKEKGITALFLPDVAEAVSQQGYDPVNGARPLRRAVQQLVEDPLAEALLKGDLKEGDEIVCSWQSGLYITHERKEAVTIG
ncbi:MAG: ATP-dependent Clp protease ATP-binding subunit [Oscillospiraceae bacterium]|nr:ATP-dependent Clp protease ATP-binding subunit [Oscillospiraceae bacterium]